MAWSPSESGRGGGSVTGRTPSWRSSSRSSASSRSGQSDAVLRARAISNMRAAFRTEYIGRLKTEHEERRKKGGKSFGGLVSNFAGDILDTITSIPDQVVVTGAAHTNRLARIVEAGADAVPVIPGAQLIESGARALKEKTNPTITAAGEALKADYKHRWGPLFAGDLDTTWDRIYDNPGFAAADVAGVYSATGAGVRASAGAMGRRLPQGSSVQRRLARVGETSILPAGRSVAGGRTSTGDRYRAPRRYETPIGENSDIVFSAEKPRRPYSRNPVTRAAQRAVEQRVTTPFARFLEQRAEGRPLLREFSADAKLARVQERQARDLRFAEELEKARRLGEATSGLSTATRRAGGIIGTPGRKMRGSAAVYLHLTDQLDVPGKTRAQARADFIDFLERGIAKDREAGLRTKQREKQVAALRAVRDEDLDLATASPEVVAAVAKARQVSADATELRLSVRDDDGNPILRRDTAEARMRRPAQIVHGGSEFRARLRRNTPELVEAATRREHAKTARDEAGKMPTRDNYVNVGRRIGRAERNIELSAPLPDYPRREISQPTRGQDYMRGRARPVDDSPAALNAELRARNYSMWLARKSGIKSRVDAPHSTAGPGFERHGIGPGRASGYASLGRARGKQAEFRMRGERIKQLRKEANDARAELARVEKQVAGEWTPPTIEGLGANASYFPDVPADVRTGPRMVKPAGALGRFSHDPIRQNKGSLLSSGNISIDTANLARAYEQALVDEMHPGAIEKMIEGFAARVPDAEGNMLIAKGPKAIMAMAADPDGVALVSERTLAQTMRNSRNRPEGESLDADFTAGMEVLEGPEGVATARELYPGGGDLVALPKTVVEAWRQGYSQASMGKWGQRLYDTPLQLWRRGILALAPRWYLNNLFGNTLMYGLLTGFDIRSILDARRGQPLAEKAPQRVASSTMIDETRMLTSTTEAQTAARRGFERVTDVGMNMNHRFESIFRRAAWLSRAKRALEMEGVKVHKMSVEEFSAALDQMPPHLKDQVLREVEMGMGDYVRLSPVERNVLKRIFPFYSWMRVIGRLMGSLPIQHPKRTAMLALMGQASNEAVNPEDFMADIYNRGRLNLPASLAWRTMSANPFTTHAELMVNVADGNLQGTVGSLARDITPVGGQQFIQMVTGRNQFGRPFTAPPGYGGSAQQFGGPRMKDSSTRGIPQEYIPTPPWHELALQTVPLVPGLVRGLTAGTRTPYDTTSTFDMVRAELGKRFGQEWGPQEREMYRAPSEYGRPTEPLTVAGRPLNPLLALIGFNVHRRNREAEIANYLDSVRRQQERAEETARARERAGILP